MNSPLRLAALCSAAAAAAAASPFTAGNLVLLRVGAAGSLAPLAPANSAPVAAPVFIDELAPSFGGLAQSIAVSGVTATNNDYTTSTLSLAADGASAVFAGSGAPAGVLATGGGAIACSGACYPGFTRVLARVAWDGGVSTSTALPAEAFGGQVKGVCAMDSRGFFVSALNTNSPLPLPLAHTHHSRAHDAV